MKICECTDNDCKLDFLAILYKWCSPLKDNAYVGFSYWCDEHGVMTKLSSGYIEHDRRNKRRKKKSVSNKPV